MAPIKNALKTIEELYTYGEVLSQVATGEIVPDAHNPAYVARLLFLADTRPIYLERLIPTLGMFPSHFYRSLSRAGVEFRTTTSRKRNVPEHLAPWHHGRVFYDPMSSTLIENGNKHNVTYSVWQDGRESLSFFAPFDKIPTIRPSLPIKLGLRQALDG